uniref:Uncharacterized protein n=1 Tax=Arundo donax TaxID=35708 RepID=A0A0A9EYE9_ARUDO
MGGGATSCSGWCLGGGATCHGTFSRTGLLSSAPSPRHLASTPTTWQLPASRMLCLPCRRSSCSNFAATTGWASCMM